MRRNSKSQCDHSINLGGGRGTVGKCTGPKWPKMVQTTILVEMALFRTGFFSIRETKIDHFGPFWPEEVHFGPFRSTNRTLVTPENSLRMLNALHVVFPLPRGPWELYTRRFSLQELRLSQEWPGKPNSGTKVQFVNRACFPKEKHQNSHKIARYS